VSAVLLAVELLLFEMRPRSIIPVALAAVVATGGNAMFPLFVLFIGFGLVRYAVAAVRRWQAPAHGKFDDDVVEPTQAKP
jgi:H+/Cl- antiporter ClcA